MAHFFASELKIEALSYVSTGFTGLAFAMSFPTMPLRCKLYTAAAAAAYYFDESKASWMTFVYFMVLLALRRTVILLLTLKSSFAPTYIFKTLSHIMPAYYFERAMFFRADDPPEDIALLREKSFDAMQVHWNAKWPKSLATSAELRKSFSDLRFAAGNRVFLPFKRILDDWCDPFTVCTETERMNLIDVDGHSQLDISGSYGVNVCGYDRYKQWISDGK
jgi:glutamate-1-semialdehyde 2,1-aminomutase